ncbi:helix-turn-helix transcriptional regulator [Ekhidna sp. MALMAid0563]|uniref:helix-turn-helix domain-containing protein n=1 Tax=Ekhidna sp. MALMAid0563 TaxID=3143937 RepID=UPI0032DF5988
MKDVAFQKRFGQHLRDFRESRGLSIRQVEINGEIDRAIISKIETGSQTATLVTLHKILKAMGTTESEFFADFDSSDD